MTEQLSEYVTVWPHHEDDPDTLWSATFDNPDGGIVNSNPRETREEALADLVAVVGGVSTERKILDAEHELFEASQLAGDEREQRLQKIQAELADIRTDSES